jgi:hypothetical protein
MTTMELMVNNANVRRYFWDREDGNQAYFYSNILLAMFEPIEIGDTYLDGFNGWEPVVATEYFRKDFRSTRYLKIPKGVTNNV